MGKEIEYNKERESYQPNNNQKDPVFKRITQGKIILFFAPIVHLGACVVFLILLLIGLLVKNGSLGFTLNKTEAALAFSYIGACVLIDLLIFMFPAKKANKKSQFRVMVILTLIMSTLIVSGSFIFWGIPTLLFYSVITLIVWVFEIIAAIYLMLAVEALPN